MDSLRSRFWVEITAAVGCGLALAATLVWPDWLELVFGVDPDGGDGTAEWVLVGALVVAVLIGSLAARREWARAARLRLDAGPQLP